VEVEVADSPRVLIESVLSEAFGLALAEVGICCVTNRPGATESLMGFPVWRIPSSSVDLSKDLAKFGLGILEVDLLYGGVGSILVRSENGCHSTGIGNAGPEPAEHLGHGCAGKLGLVQRRWPAAIDALRDATGPEAARAYVGALRGYFTGDAGQYTSSLLSLAAECLRGPEEQWPATADEIAPVTLPSPVPVEVPQAVDVVRGLATDDDSGDIG
jgi:hypothetical protein